MTAGRATARLAGLVLACLVVGTAPAQAQVVAGADVDAEIARYVDHYLRFFPTRATAAGDHRHDRELENFTRVRLADWLDANRRIAVRLDAALAGAHELSTDQRIDAELVLRQARRELFRHQTLRASERDPLFWTGVVGQMSSHLLVRDDLPLAERLRALAVRVGEVPRLCQQAHQALQRADPAEVVAMHAATAAGQARATATFLATGLARAADGVADPDERATLAARLAQVGQAASGSLQPLADFLDGLAASATGSPRLGELYADNFRLVTGVGEPVAEILADADARLVAERSSTADFCRGIWSAEGIDRASGLAEPPDDDLAAVRACFARIALDHAENLDDFRGDFQRLAREAQDFAVSRGVVELPAGFRLVVDHSPDYFVGQSVGGVYPAGPFAPDGATLLFVPGYPQDTPADAAAGFYRDFNDHFNTMITPHETVPGHAAQLAVAAHRAARLGRPARELFADGVYTEGWGTFSELLMLDLGWGGPLDRVAHLKKRLENVARLIVDIRVHTTDVEQDEILRFVRDEALQDEQFAANMWRRALLSSPQLTTYDLGSRRIARLYDAERERLGEAFDPGAFVRAMTELGSAPLARYVERFSHRATEGPEGTSALLGSDADAAASTAPSGPPPRRSPPSWNEDRNDPNGL